MEGFLTKNQIRYVLLHLDLCFELSEELISCMRFLRTPTEQADNPTIDFMLSVKGFRDDQLLFIDGLPVLFPFGKHEKFYSIKENGIVFHHDLLKSAFYLLSGYQEQEPEYLDTLGRYPYELSVQAKLGIIDKPIVNYYFQVISDGIKQFCELNHLPWKERSPTGMTLFLSHDVDQVDTYSLNETLYYLKKCFTGGQKGVQDNRDYKKYARIYTKNYFRPGPKKNPAWSFPYLLEKEKSRQIISSYFFLPRGQKHQDAYYRFTEKRIQRLFSLLIEEGCEIGLHGTVQSAISGRTLISNLNELNEASPSSVKGIRQHRLMYQQGITSRLHEAAGVRYDTTLGFAAHEGFRNSFCLPFRLFDHQNDKMLDVWEIPLMVMDVTLFHYRKYDFAEAMDAVNRLITEVRKFEGVFSLLWHNSFLNEETYPGIRSFYEELLDRLSSAMHQCETGERIIDRMDPVSQKFLDRNDPLNIS